MCQKVLAVVDGVDNKVVNMEVGDIHRVHKSFCFSAFIVLHNLFYPSILVTLRHHSFLSAWSRIYYIFVQSHDHIYRTQVLESLVNNRMETAFRTYMRTDFKVVPL